MFRKARGEFSEGSGEAISGMGKDKMQSSVSKVSGEAGTYFWVFFLVPFRVDLGQG